MAEQIELCPNCGEKLKDGMFSKNFLLSRDRIRLVNTAFSLDWDQACDSCGAAKADEALVVLTKEKDDLAKKLNVGLPQIRALTLLNPQGWQYNCVGLVTAQSVAGTGVFSKITTAFTDTLEFNPRSTTKRFDLARRCACLRCASRH